MTQVFSIWRDILIVIPKLYADAVMLYATQFQLPEFFKFFADSGKSIGVTMPFLLFQKVVIQYVLEER